MTEQMNKTKYRRGYENPTVPKAPPKEQLKIICETFLSKKEYDGGEPEIEVRFGTKGIKPLTKMDYDNVIKKLQSLGFFVEDPKGQYSLKIETEFLDIKTGQFRSSNIRLEIYNFDSIKEYCKTNDIERAANALTVMKKSPIFVDDRKINSADYDDFNFRVSFAREETISKNSKLVKDTFDNWARTKKGFRYINRVSLIKPGVPFRIDLSIVRTSSKDTNGWPIKTYTVGESNVFTNQEHYEIEIEVNNNEARFMFKTAEEMMKGIEQITKNVLSGLQKTNYPISYKEQKSVLDEYMQLTKGDQYNPDKHKYPKSSDFIGPSSVTLHVKNIVPINPNMNVPNIRKDYVVTDKADGERSLLFIHKNGKMYLISSKMEVMFTGSKTEVNEFKYSLLDGELILHNKNKQYINLYAAFDLYFLNGQDIRSFGFASTTEKDAMTSNRLRLPLLRNLVAKLNVVSITDKTNPTNQLRITTKRFYPVVSHSERVSHKDEDLNIFDACHYILQNVKDGLYEYNTDGLIFTPSNFGVGGDKPGVTRPIKTWEYSFKWKPPHFNTIDFLITTQKSPNGGDVVTPIFENGMDMLTVTQFTQYKTVVLRCGFDESDHGYINPCQDIIEDKLPEFIDKKGSKQKNWRPVQFYPTSSYGNNAGLCNIVLEEDDNGTYQMFTKEREVIEDNAVVEFSYDLSKTGLWRWTPLRVRYDKTYPNDYKTADDNWVSIHNPVTLEMITTGEHIPDVLAEDDVYYNRVTNITDTVGMRDFHNLFVKKLLIERVSKKGDTLIDYACGKGGDLPKWIASNLSFVFGIDISKDNLENRINGACARFLNFKKDFKNMPYALFVNGNASLNIRTGEAMLNDKAIQITKAVFGQGSKENLGNGIIRQYGKGEDGFNVSSCQFAVHYMFESVRTLHNFLRNVAECTKLNGYFIGTSYDGKTIFNKLRKKLVGDSIEIYEKDTKVWQVVKEYDYPVFEDDESCIGYKISVYQDSINKMFPEYLVNYDYLNRIMEDYGFTLLPREDAKKIGIPEGSGMFNELYSLMMNEIKRYPSKENDFGHAPEMKNYEKDISFLNRYFIYKKIRTVNAKKIAESFISRLPDEIVFEKKETAISQKETKQAIQETKPKIKKLNKKIILVASPDSPGEPGLGIHPVEPKMKTKRPNKSIPKKQIDFDVVGDF